MAQFTKPTVAVLLAAYNGVAWIEEQLASILAQQGVEVCVFISIDLSTDDTHAWCEAYARHHPQIHILAPCGRMGGAAANFFRLFRDVDLSRFQFVSLADQDDHWRADKLQRAINCLQAGDHDAYSSNVTAFWPDGRKKLLDKAQPQVRWDYLFEAAGPGCTYVMNASLVDALKAKLSSHWEQLQSVSLHDWFIYAFARSQGFSWYIDTESGLDYRQHAANQVGANIGIASMWSRFKTIQDGWWFGQVFLISSILGHPWALLDVASSQRRRVFLMLAWHAAECRRRPRDRRLFRIICIIAAVKGCAKTC